MTTLPMILDNRSGLPVPHQPASTQLGTAAWYRGGGRAIGPFKIGDFWLGRTDDGQSVGLRDDRHIGITASTRGGKGVSIIVPNLCLWPGSVVVIDPKGENAMVTARRRGQGSEYCEGLGQTVRLLDPFNVMGVSEEEKATFNPLDALDPNSEECVDGATSIAESLIVMENSSDPFFEESARGLVKDFILHVRTGTGFAPSERNLNKVRELLMAGDAKGAELAAMNGKKNPPSGFALLFDAMKRNRVLNGVISRAGEMLAHMEATSPRLFGSVVQVARTNTNFLDSPGMARVLKSSTFKLSDLKTDPRGVSLYISLPQRFMETHSGWLRMMTTLIVMEMERVAGKPASGHPVLMVLDEFPALKRMRVLENAAAQIAGFGVKMVFVSQTLTQLKNLYKDNWETLIANAGVKLFFCNDDNFTREYISRSIGDREIVRTVSSVSESVGSSQSFSHGRNSGSSVSFSHTGTNLSAGMSVSSSVGTSESFTMGRNSSQTRGISETLHKRALITPDEVGRLFGNAEDMRAIAIVSGYQPMALNRTPYFRDVALEACYDGHRDHPKPPSRVVVRQIRKQLNEKAQRDAIIAQQVADAERRRQAVILQEYWRQQNRITWIQHRVVEVKLALLCFLAIGTVYLFWPVLVTIWQFLR